MSATMLGVHCSISGGLYHAFEEAEKLGIDTFQIFTQNQRQWINKKLADEDVKKFRDTWPAKKIKTIFSHCSYLLNLASPDETLRKKSIDALVGEVERCHALGLSFCVLHPGATMGQEEPVALGNIIDGLKSVLKSTSHSKVMVLVENTAGQGSSLGNRFEQLHTILEEIDSTRMGVCFDTCHAFAAGYDLRTKAAYKKTFDDFDKIVGLKHLQAIHLNDSKGDLGSRVDRHDHIGKGKIGKEAFRNIVHDFPKIPKVIETDKDNDMDAVNLKVLRAMG